MRKVKFLDGPLEGKVLVTDDANHINVVEKDQTATFETSLHGMPQILTYRIEKLVEFEEWSPRRFIRTKPRTFWVGYLDSSLLNDETAEEIFRELATPEDREYEAPKPHLLNEFNRYVEWSRMKHMPERSILYQEARGIGVDPSRVTFQ